MATKVRVGGTSAIKVSSTSRAEAGGTLSALSDTSIASPVDGHLLVYNGTTGLWTSQSTLGANTDIDGGTF
jgi:hypothetical protein